MLATETRLELQIVGARMGGVIVGVPVERGGRIELRYKHSVERTPVVEVFEVDAAGLTFVEMRFVSQGAGLPTEGYVREGGEFVLRRRRHVGALPLLVSAVAGQVVWVGGQGIDLVGAAGDGAHVSLGTRSVRRLRRLP